MVEMISVPCSVRDRASLRAAVICRRKRIKLIPETKQKKDTSVILTFFMQIKWKTSGTATPNKRIHVRSESNTNFSPVSTMTMPASVIFPLQVLLQRRHLSATNSSSQFTFPIRVSVSSVSKLKTFVGFHLTTIFPQFQSANLYAFNFAQAFLKVLFNVSKGLIQRSWRRWMTSRVDLKSCPFISSTILENFSKFSWLVSQKSSSKLKSSTRWLLLIIVSV